LNFLESKSARAIDKSSLWDGLNLQKREQSVKENQPQARLSQMVAWH